MGFRLLNRYRKDDWRVETQVVSCPIPVCKRRMTTASDEAGPSTSQPQEDSTPNLTKGSLMKKVWYAPSKGPSKSSMELCRTLIPMQDSPMAPPLHEKGPKMETPLAGPVGDIFRASCHIQGSKPYENVSEKNCKSCMVCGRSVDAIKMEKLNIYMSLLPQRTRNSYESKKRSIVKRSECRDFTFHTNQLCCRLPPVTE